MFVCYSLVWKSSEKVRRTVSSERGSGKCWPLLKFEIHAGVTTWSNDAGKSRDDLHDDAIDREAKHAMSHIVFYRGRTTTYRTSCSADSQLIPIEWCYIRGTLTPVFDLSLNYDRIRYRSFLFFDRSLIKFHGTLAIHLYFAWIAHASFIIFPQSDHVTDRRIEIAIAYRVQCHRRFEDSFRSRDETTFFNFHHGETNSTL